MALVFAICPSTTGRHHRLAKLTVQCYYRHNGTNRKQPTVTEDTVIVTEGIVTLTESGVTVTEYAATMTGDSWFNSLANMSSISCDVMSS